MFEEKLCFIFLWSSRPHCGSLVFQSQLNCTFSRWGELSVCNSAHCSVFSDISMMEGISPWKSFGCFYIPLLLIPLKVSDRVLFLNASFRLAEMAKGVDSVEFASGLCNASLTDLFLYCHVGVKMQWSRQCAFFFPGPEDCLDCVCVMPSVLSLWRSLSNFSRCSVQIVPGTCMSP